MDKNITVEEKIVTEARRIKAETKTFKDNKATLEAMLQSECRAYKPGQRNHQKMVDALKLIIDCLDIRIEQNDSSLTRLIADSVIPKL